mgnify:CR=1 FL=1
MAPAFCYSYDVGFRETHRAVGRCFKFAKFLYLGPFLFGYVPGFSLNGSSTDILVAFVLIFVGTFAYSWFLSGIWYQPLKALFAGTKS